jgi:hypothetical protein
MVIDLTFNDNISTKMDKLQKNDLYLHHIIKQPHCSEIGKLNVKKLTSSVWFLMAGCAFGYPLWTADYKEN